MHYVDSNGVTIFALLPDGSLLLRPLAAPPTGTKAGLKLCNVNPWCRELRRHIHTTDVKTRGTSSVSARGRRGVLLASCQVDVSLGVAASH